MVTANYTIGFDVLRTYAELQQLRDRLKADYPHLLDNVRIVYDGYLILGIYCPEYNLELDRLRRRPVRNGRLLDYEPVSGVQALYSFRRATNTPTNDRFWNQPQFGGSYDGHLRDWGFHAVNASDTWNLLANTPPRRQK